MNLGPRIASTVLLAVLSLAAGISAKAGEYNQEGEILIVTGIFDECDQARFSAYKKDGWEGVRKVVFVNHRGGDVSVAVSFGKLIRERGWDTSVIGLCGSACPMAFAGGVNRTLHRDATIQVHPIQPVLKDPLTVEDVTRWFSKIGKLYYKFVWDYFDEMGVDGELITRFSWDGVDEMRILSPDELVKTKIITQPNK